VIGGTAGRLGPFVIEDVTGTPGRIAHIPERTIRAGSSREGSATTSGRIPRTATHTPETWTACRASSRRRVDKALRLPSWTRPRGSPRRYDRVRFPHTPTVSRPRGYGRGGRTSSTTSRPRAAGRRRVGAFVARSRSRYVVRENREAQVFDLIDSSATEQRSASLRSIRHYNGQPIRRSRSQRHSASRAVPLERLTGSVSRDGTRERPRPSARAVRKKINHQPHDSRRCMYELGLGAPSPREDGRASAARSRSGLFVETAQGSKRGARPGMTASPSGASWPTQAS